MAQLHIEQNQLPAEISIANAIEAAYPEELAQCEQAIRQRLPLLIECDKELMNLLYVQLRNRLRACELTAMFIDGRVSAVEINPLEATGMMAILGQLRDAVRGPAENRVLVLPHLDLLTSSQGMLTAEARETISLLYENPDLLFIGFCDPSFLLPQVIERLFPRRVQFCGLHRERLNHLVCQREARKLGETFSPYELYKYVSGLNAIRLRRLLSTLEGEDYPADSSHAYMQLRQATILGDADVPNVSLTEDIGGYEMVKKKLTEEIIALLERKDQMTTPEEVARIEALIPRGMIFWGPPGTGKTLFAKAMATALNASIHIVSGPELKSKWVGESEGNLRSVFMRARQSAPSVIVFDELDSFAHARGAYFSSGVEHSMVNQLLTEMDGFRKEELVFVVGTTNFVESLDPALLRPGRFEFHIEVPYPGSNARRAILEIYDRKFGLKMSPATIDTTVNRTQNLTPDTGTPYSGDHIQALCRQIARDRLRAGRCDETTRADVDAAIAKSVERPDLTQKERVVLATHESGHAITALYCDHVPPVERVSLSTEIAGALGVTQFKQSENKYVVNDAEIKDRLCVCYGGLVAEKMLLGAVSIGANRDLAAATGMARAMLCEFGMTAGVPRLREITDGTIHVIDREVEEILSEAFTRTGNILKEHRSEVMALRDMLLERGVVEGESIFRTNSKKEEKDPSADEESSS